MFTLIKFIFSLTVIAVVAYVFLIMPLGEKTLLEHLVGISKTDEAVDLKQELGKKVEGATSKLKRRASQLAQEELEKQAQESKVSDDSPTLKEVSREDRRRLTQLIQTKQREDSEKEDRAALGRLIHQKRLENK